MKNRTIPTVHKFEREVLQEGVDKDSTNEKLYTKEDLRRAYNAGCPISWSDFGVTMTDENFDAYFNRIHAKTMCLVVTCLPCDHPIPWLESPKGCCECGMLEWLSAFETEDECNQAFKKQYPQMFDENGDYINQNK